MPKSKLDRNRRKVLQIIGSSSVGLVGFSGSVSASTPEFRGVAYDTLTQESIGTVRGKIKQTNNDLQGKIDIAGFSLPLEKLELASNKTKPKYTETFKEEKFQNDNLPLKFMMYDHSIPNSHFSGTVTHSSGEFGRIGFYLTADQKVNAEELVESRTPRNKLEESSLSFSAPKEGVPKDTGSAQIIKQLKGEKQ